MTCRSRSGRRHSPHKRAFETAIHYRYHPRCGERVLVVGCRHHGGEAYFILEQPDGSRALIPAWMANPQAVELETVAVPRIGLAALNDLRRLLDSLLSSCALRPKARKATGGVNEAEHQTSERSISHHRTAREESTRKRALARSSSSGRPAMDGVRKTTIDPVEGGGKR